MITISYIVAVQLLDYIITIMVEFTSKKQFQMIAISYIVTVQSPDYIITITVESTLKNSFR